MANEFSDLSAALQTVRERYAAICEATADEPRASTLQHALSCAILRELETVFDGLRGQDGRHFAAALGGPPTTGLVQSGYPELSEL